MPNISNKLLIISGPTATGKTSLAVYLAKKFNGELISADSRQIYLGMDVGTGKDHPKNTIVHLVDIINPDQAFSVAQYRLLALEKIKEIQNKGKLPIIVGGTGQYIDSVVNYKDTYSIKPNRFLRYFLNNLSLKKLQKVLSLLDYKTFSTLNNSDRNNPHRLIRKIEIAIIPGKKSEIKNNKINNFFHISLTAPNVFLYSRINQRIQDRLNSGLLKEIKSLLEKYKWSDPGLNTLAYKEFINLDKGQTLESCVKKWQSDEHKYLRRQKTWFKKQPNLHFIDISKNNREEIIDLVSRWYNEL